MIRKVKIQEKLQKDQNSKTCNICPKILHVDADVDADAGGLAIALLL